MLNKRVGSWLRCGCCGLLLLAGGCVLSPKGTKAETDRVDRAGTAYQQPPAKRVLPALPDHPDRQDVVDRAMLADGELEASYFQWAAAMQRVIQAGTYPNTNLSLGVSYMLRGGGSAWDRTTVQVSPDGMQTLNWPSEVSTAAKIAFKDAQATGERYGVMRRQVIQRASKAWLDYTLSAEEIRLQKQDVDLLKLAERSAEASMSAGGSQQSLLDAQMASAAGREKLHELESMQRSQQATLNAMMRRPVEAPLTPAAELPAPADMPLSDEQLLKLAAQRDPELAALAHDVQGRAEAIKLAKMQYLPDLMPQAAFTGGVWQMIGAAVSMPVDRLPAIAAMVREAQDQWRVSTARYEQAKFDRAAQVVAALVMMRHNHHNVMLFSQQVLPVAKQVVASLRDNYAAGDISLNQLINAQRTVLAVERTIAEARIGREKYLADLQAVVGSLAGLHEPAHSQNTSDSAGASSSPPMAMEGPQTHPVRPDEKAPPPPAGAVGKDDR